MRAGYGPGSQIPRLPVRAAQRCRRAAAQAPHHPGCAACGSGMQQTQSALRSLPRHPQSVRAARRHWPGLSDGAEIPHDRLTAL